MFRTLAITLCWLLLCSCAATNEKQAITPAEELPPELTINKDAGHGNWLFVKLRLEDGEEIPFFLDTGASGTVLDKSLEPKLGKYLGIEPTTNWKGKGKANVYAAPKLYLGNIRLITGNKICTIDLQHRSGILGMDCLKHYCIQLDFVEGKMRFLKSEQVNAADLGKAYPITFRGNLPFIHHVGLVASTNTNLLIDTGCRPDGLVGTNTISGSQQFLPLCIWDGQTYSNLTVHAVENGNALGLQFLAHHLVTLDLPNRIMYLKLNK